MSIPAILKKTGTVSDVHRAGDLRYLNEELARNDRHFIEINSTDLAAMEGHPWIIYTSGSIDSGIPRRLPAEIIGRRNNGSPLHSGIISPDFSNALKVRLERGERLYVRKAVGPKTLSSSSPYVLQHARGELRPLTYAAKIRAAEIGWTDDMPLKAKMLVCSKLIRSSIRGRTLTRRTVKGFISTIKTVRPVAAHNLVFCPSPIELNKSQIQELPIDALMEKAARRAMEQYEQKSGSRLIAVCSTHLQDSKGFRPHLHIRLAAYDSAGKYVPIFDRKGGHSGGNRCRFEDEMRRQFTREIERNRNHERYRYENRRHSD